MAAEPEVPLPRLCLDLQHQSRPGLQVVVGGQPAVPLQRAHPLGAGVGSLPGVRTTEGNFPYWLSVDNRLTADEFFRRPTRRESGRRGPWSDGLDYYVMVGNNLSQFGVDAGQMDNSMDTWSFSLTLEADHRRVREGRRLRRLRAARPARDADRRQLHPQRREPAEPAEHRVGRELADPALGRERHLHARACSARASSLPTSPTT